jgi:hypothetical protein
MIKTALEGENIYKTKPGVGGRRVKGKKKQAGGDEEDEDEDTTILNMKDLKKK